MVLGVDGASPASFSTFLPNLFIIGDTVSPDPKLDAIVETAILLTTKALRH